MRRHQVPKAVRTRELHGFQYLSTSGPPAGRRTLWQCRHPMRIPHAVHPLLTRQPADERLSHSRRRVMPVDWSLSACHQILQAVGFVTSAVPDWSVCRPSGWLNTLLEYWPESHRFPVSEGEGSGSWRLRRASASSVPMLREDICSCFVLIKNKNIVKQDCQSCLTEAIMSKTAR